MKSPNENRPGGYDRAATQLVYAQNLCGYCSESDPGTIESQTFVSSSVSIGAIGAKTYISVAG